MASLRFPWSREGRTVSPRLHADRLASLDGRPYRLTTDAWAKQPQFGFDFLADAIAKVILDSDPQLTLAVYGPWGVGKTTLLRAIDERISEQCVVAWFDMWEYKNQEHVIAQLLDTIAGALPRRSELARGLRSLSRLALASASLTAGNVSFSGKSLLSELDRLWEGPGVESKQLEALVDRWRRRYGGQRIVVVVDNLDRVLPEHSVGLLEQISSLFGFPGVVFLLAAERDRLAAAVEQEHELPEGEGLVYIEKIVQVEFRVPGLSRDHVLRWIRALAGRSLELDDSEIRLLADTAGWNPRQIKRLLNNIRMLLCTAPYDVEEDGGLAFASTLLLHHDPSAWLALTTSPEARKELDNALNGPD